ncbi:MAG: hypothetical protein FWD57_12860, partial [Polyangiaceae bacterium]|nr:hypothetical protein [Polyangiaceae bacterium]
LMVSRTLLMLLLLLLARLHLENQRRHSSRYCRSCRLTGLPTGLANAADIVRHDGDGPELHSYVVAVRLASLACIDGYRPARRGADRGCAAYGRQEGAKNEHGYRVFHRCLFSIGLAQSLLFSWGIASLFFLGVFAGVFTFHWGFSPVASSSREPAVRVLEVLRTKLGILTGAKLQPAGYSK